MYTWKTMKCILLVKVSCKINHLKWLAIYVFLTNRFAYSEEINHMPRIEAFLVLNLSFKLFKFVLRYRRTKSKNVQEIKISDWTKKTIFENTDSRFLIILFVYIETLVNIMVIWLCCLTRIIFTLTSKA